MRSSLVLACALSVALIACDKSEDAAPAAAPNAGEAAAPKAEVKTLDALFTTKAPALPAPYQGLKLGMTGDEAKKIFPAMPEEDTIKLPEYPDVRFNVDFDKNTKRIQRVYFDLPKAEAEALLTKAWGAPVKGQTTIKKPISYWFNPAAGIRATLEEGFGDDMKLEFTAYTPAATFVGAEGKAFAFESKQPILGATIEELRAAYPLAIQEKSQAQADADRAKMEKMMGKDADKLKVLGQAKPSAHLDFPPTEYESYWTRVNLTWDDEGKVKRYRFKLGFRAYEPEKEALFALLSKKFGEVKEEEKYGKKLFVAGDAPRIEIQEDTISKGWDVTVERPAD